MPESDDVVGYKSPPRSTRYPAGVSGNAKGRPKRKHKGLPYARILVSAVSAFETARGFHVGRISGSS